MSDPILTNLRSILEETTGIEAAEIDLLTTLEDLGIDSLDMIELIMSCEETFEIEIPESESAGIRTVAGLYDVILRAQGITLD